MFESAFQNLIPWLPLIYCSEVCAKHLDYKFAKESVPSVLGFYILTLTLTIKNSSPSADVRIEKRSLSNFTFVDFIFRG